MSSGIGAFWGTTENTAEKRFATIGFPMEAATSVNIFPFAFNPVHSFFGFGMDVQIGKLRDIDFSILRTSRF